MQAWLSTYDLAFRRMLGSISGWGEWDGAFEHGLGGFLEWTPRPWWPSVARIQCMRRTGMGGRALGRALEIGAVWRDAARGLVVHGARRV